MRPTILTLLAQRKRWGAPFFARFAKGGHHERLRQRSLCRPISKRDPGPSLIHSHRSGLVQKIETITAPAPFLGCVHQSPLHRIAMYVSQLLGALFRRPYVEVVEARLPERPALRIAGEQIGLARVLPLVLR